MAGSIQSGAVGTALTLAQWTMELPQHCKRVCVFVSLLVFILEGNLSVHTGNMAVREPVISLKRPSPPGKQNGHEMHFGDCAHRTEQAHFKGPTFYTWFIWWLDPLRGYVCGPENPNIITMSLYISFLRLLSGNPATKRQPANQKTEGSDPLLPNLTSLITQSQSLWVRNGW